MGDGRRWGGTVTENKKGVVCCRSECAQVGKDMGPCEVWGLSGTPQRSRRCVKPTGGGVAAGPVGRMCAGCEGFLGSHLGWWARRRKKG